MAEANVSHWMVAPVAALNFAFVDSNQAFCSFGYCALVLMNTLRVLPAPALVSEPVLVPPPLLQAARATTRTLAPTPTNAVRFIL